MYSLDSFDSEFWDVQEWPLKHTHGQPTSVEAALWEMPAFPNLMDMVRRLFPEYHPQDIGISDIMTLIRETNTCSNLDSPVEVWIDEKGVFKIKVYS